jgi:hypothetical protein
MQIVKKLFRIPYTAKLLLNYHHGGIDTCILIRYVYTAQSSVGETWKTNEE